MFRMPPTHYSPLPPKTSSPVVVPTTFSYTPHPPSAAPKAAALPSTHSTDIEVHTTPAPSQRKNEDSSGAASAVCKHIIQLFDQADYARVVRYTTKAVLILEDGTTTQTVSKSLVWDMAWRIAASLCLVGAWDDALCVIGLYRSLCVETTATDGDGGVRPDAMEAGIEFLRADENTSSLSNREMLGIMGVGSPHRTVPDAAASLEICTQTTTPEDTSPSASTTAPSPIEVVQRVMSWLDESGLQRAPLYTLTVDTAADPNLSIGEYFGRVFVNATPPLSNSPTRHSPLGIFADEDDVCWSPRDRLAPPPITTSNTSSLRPPTLPLLLVADIKMEVVGSEAEDVGRRGVSTDATGMYIETTCKALLKHDDSDSNPQHFAVELHTRAVVVLLMRTVLRQRAYSVPLPKLFISYMLGSWEDHGEGELPMRELVDAAYVTDPQTTQSITNLSNVDDADWNSSSLHDLLMGDSSTQQHHHTPTDTTTMPSREEYIRQKLWGVVWGRYGRVLEGMRRAVWECMTAPPLSLIYHSSHSSSMSQLHEVLREKLHVFCCAAVEGVDGIEVLQYVDFTTSGTWRGLDSTPSALRTWLSTASPRLVQGFLLLTTGLTCLPTNTGLASPIHIVRDDTRLFARTCFYELLVPEFGNFGDLADSIELACNESLARHASMGNMGES